MAVRPPSTELAFGEPVKSNYKGPFHSLARNMLLSVPLPFAAALIALLAALAASVLTHFLTAGRDRKNEQRRQRATVLLNAFVALLSASNRPALHEVSAAIERAIAEIQAIGTPAQIELAQTFARGLIAKQEVSMDPLLESLRSFLRTELGAEPVTGPIVWLRIGPPTNES